MRFPLYYVMHKILHGDCLDVLRTMPDDSVDLVIGSPPYSDARTYGIGFSLKGQDWVDWAFERYMECVRVSRGAVCWVVGGRTRKYRWDATPTLLMADLHRAGVNLRKTLRACSIGLAEFRESIRDQFHYSYRQV